MGEILEPDVVTIEVEKTDQEIREERAALSREYYEARKAGRVFIPREIRPTKTIRKYKSKYDNCLYETFVAARDADMHKMIKRQEESSEMLMSWMRNKLG